MAIEARPELVALLKTSRSMLIFTGAGISTSSGIPDYRGPQGVWKAREPVYYQDFMRDHEARVEYWDQKLEAWPQIRDAVPGTTHDAVTRLERAGKIIAVVTQNIDGLHEKAGTSRDLLVELHGSNLKVECMSCHVLSDPDPHFSAFADTRQPPACASCGGHLKPATISFGQSLRQEDIYHAARAADSADLVIALGSTLSVHPAASIPLTAAQRGTPYVIINRGVTEQDGMGCVTLRLDGDVGEIFPVAVEDALGGSGGFA